MFELIDSQSVSARPSARVPVRTEYGDNHYCFVEIRTFLIIVINVANISKEIRRNCTGQALLETTTYTTTMFIPFDIWFGLSADCRLESHIVLFVDFTIFQLLHDGFLLSLCYHTTRSTNQWHAWNFSCKTLISRTDLAETSPVQTFLRTRRRKWEKKLSKMWERDCCTVSGTWNIIFRWRREFQLDQSDSSQTSLIISR